MRTPRDLSGMRFGNLVVIKKDQRTDKQHHSFFLCQCDCGKQKIVSRSHLVTGASKSCGCKVAESARKRATHGASFTRLFSIWVKMKGRCFSKSNGGYKYYGARGITVCDEWANNFQVFKDWSVKNGYSDDLSIDRIDVNGNYEPSNCRWIPIGEQARNRRCNRLVTIDGETKLITDWCKESPVSTTTVYERMRKGWKVNDALFTKDLRKMRKSS